MAVVEVVEIILQELTRVEVEVVAMVPREKKDTVTQMPLAATPALPMV